jgi:hypothetical protein
MKTLTYGVMPSFAEFEKAFDAAMREEGLPHYGPYSYRLKGKDADVMSALGRFVQNEATCTELFRTVCALCEAFKYGNDDAGDLAASFLYTLGFEWI